MLVRAILPLLTLLCAACSDDSAAGAAPPVGGTAELESRLTQAKANGHVVLIDFFTTWCEPCKRLDRETWSDPQVKAWFAEHGQLWKVDAEAEPRLASRFRVDSYPTIVFLRGDGSELDRLTGFRDADKFLKEAALALQGITSLDRALESLKGRENSPMVRAELARELAEKARFEEALGHYLWCFDHGVESDPAYVGVRGSFLLGEIEQLGRRYPPALDALRTRRDAAEDRVAQLDSDSRAANMAALDACKLNEKLGEPHRTLAIYDRLRALVPEPPIAAVLREQLVEQLADARRYGEVLQSCSNRADRMVERRLKFYAEVGQRSVGLGSDAEAAEFAAHRRRFAVQRTALYYEAELGAGTSDRASEIASTLIAFDKSGATFGELIRRARRAGRTDVVQDLLAAADRSLSGAELELARKAAQSRTTSR